jgi:hypothetical protein
LELKTALEFASFLGIVGEPWGELGLIELISQLFEPRCARD